MSISDQWNVFDCEQLLSYLQIGFRVEQWAISSPVYVALDSRALGKQTCRIREQCLIRHETTFFLPFYLNEIPLSFSASAIKAGLIRERRRGRLFGTEWLSESFGCGDVYVYWQELRPSQVSIYIMLFSSPLDMNIPDEATVKVLGEKKNTIRAITR